MTGCQQEDDFQDQKSLLENVSLELEEYIMAGLDFQHTVNTFNDEIKKIDFSKLNIHLDSKGNKTVYIPTSVSIEEKARVFNEKKRLVLEKCPEIASFSSKTMNNYFQESIQNSVNINNKMLELGISADKPRLKKGTVENFDNSDDYCAYLAEYVNSANYVETFLVVFEDGSAITYTDNRNTSSTCYDPGFSQSGDQWYVNGYPNKPVSYVAHTHVNSDTPSPADITFRDDHPGLNTAIYYSGDMSWY
jgi:hypothetical protein